MSGLFGTAYLRRDDGARWNAQEGAWVTDNSFTLYDPSEQECAVLPKGASWQDTDEASFSAWMDHNLREDDEEEED